MHPVEKRDWENGWRFGIENLETGDMYESIAKTIYRIMRRFIRAGVPYRPYLKNRDGTRTVMFTTVFTNHLRGIKMKGENQ